MRGYLYICACIRPHIDTGTRDVSRSHKLFFSRSRFLSRARALSRFLSLLSFVFLSLLSLSLSLSHLLSTLPSLSPPPPTLPQVQARLNTNSSNNPWTCTRVYSQIDGPEQAPALTHAYAGAKRGAGEMMSPDLPPSQARAWPHDTGGGGYAPQLRYPPLPGRDPAPPPRGSRATYNAEGHYKEEGRELQRQHNNGALHATGYSRLPQPTITTHSGALLRQYFVLSY